VRVLFLAPYVPFPVVHGGRNRTLGLLRCLVRFAEVRVLAAGDPAAAEARESRERLAALGVSLEVFQPTGPGPEEADAYDLLRPPDALSHFRCPTLREALPRVIREFPPDVVQLEELVMAQYADALPAPRIVDRQKVEWAYHEAVAVGDDEAAAALRREAARFRRFEERVAGQFARVIVIGAEDKRILEPLYSPEAIDVVPIGVDDAIRRPEARTSEVRHVLLYGTLDYAPNVEANGIYFRDVWPAISTAVPELRTVVVGSGPAPASLRNAGPRVDLRGYVPDIAEVLQGPGVLVVPLRVGGGARTKILEALAAGMPVVSTAIGVENLGLEPGRHYLQAETTAETVAAVLRLVRDPGLAASLGRAGAAHVDGAFRHDVLGRQIESIYARVAPAAAPPRRATPRGTGRALLVGVRPLPEEMDARGLTFPGHRTAQFRAALRASGIEVVSALLDEDASSPSALAEVDGPVHVLAPEAFRAGRELQRLHDEARPDLVVSAGGYHPARVVAQLTTDRPRYIDLAGDLAAEGQVRAAHAGDGVLADYLSVLRRALMVGDRFSVVGPSQRLLVLGQLGLMGRLTAASVGESPVDVTPLAVRGPGSASALPEGGLRVLWNGGYNTWMDVPTLFTGVEKAMGRHPGLAFVSTGGPIAGHSEDSYRQFWSLARASAFAGRFEDRGRVSRRLALETLDGCHVVLSISRPCLEAEVGSRQRVVEGLAHGRPAVMTRLGDLAAAIEEAGAGLPVPPGDADALAEALGRLASESGRLPASADRARRLWEERFTEHAATAGLRSWATSPRRWPESVADDEGLARLAADRLRLQGELDHIRGSVTFRALRLFDRLIGRSGD
jgi:glycosyltransferase involved in cell wall biosynthesis